jgi:DNA primase
MDQVEEIKSKIDIVSLINDYLPLKKSGRNYQALCPFHDEKTPSFMVSPELQIYKCFGCGAGGDAIKFLEEYEKIEFWEALEILAKRAGVKLEKKQGKEENKKKRLYEVNNLAANFYHFILIQREEGKKALEYLTGRGIKKKTIKKFNLGFSPPGQNSVIKYLKNKGYTDAEINQTGLTAKGRSGYYERFYSRVVFPLYNHRANIVGFSGRIIPGISSPKAAKYINIPNTPLYKKGRNLYGLWLTKNEIRDQKEAVIVEGEFDLISPYQEGIKNIVAIKGTAFTPEQAKLISRYAQKAIFALDADAAGSEAVRRSSGIAEKEGLEIKVAVLPEGYKDPDDLAAKNADLFKKVLNKAVSVYDYVIQTAVKRYDHRDPSDQRKILSQALPFINQIENAVIKQHYLKKIADIFGVSLDSVIIEAGKIDSKTGRWVEKDNQENKNQLKSKNRRLLLEEELVSLIIISKEWDYLDNEKILNLITTPRLKKILEEAGEYRQKTESFILRDFFQNLPGELKPGFEKLIFLEEANEDVSREEIKETIEELTKEACRNQLAEISKKIKRCEQEGKKEEVQNLEQKYVEVSKKLSNLDKNM